MSTENTSDDEALGSDGPSSAVSPVAQPGEALPPPAMPVGTNPRDVSDDRDSAVDPWGRTFGGVAGSDAPVLVGVAFRQQLMAQEYLMAMSRLRSEGSLKLKDAVIVEKNEDGGVKVTETIDPTPGRSALNGAMWTGLLGLFVGGPVGWLAGIGIGAGAGAVTAKVIDLGIPDDWVDWFKQAVQPGTSAVIILAEQVDVGALQREAHRFPGAELIESTLPEAAIADLAAAFERR